MKWFNIPSLILVLLSTFIILFIDPTSVLSYLYTVTIFLIINHLLGNKQEKINFYFFHFYLFIAIIIYIYQQYITPQYMGLTGPEGGVGTDDVRFYAWLLDGNVPYSINFNINVTHPFAVFLNLLYPFHIQTPLNIVIFNLLGIVFLPYFTYMLSLQFLSDKRVASLSQKLIFFCPYCMSMGLIIMRDMWITTFVVAGLYYFIHKKYWQVLLFAALIAFIRFGSIAFFIVGILVFSKDIIYSYIRNKRDTFLIMGLGITLVIAMFYFLSPLLVGISEGKFSGDLFRSGISVYFSKVDENGTLLKLMALPVWLRTPALTAFFYICPFLSFNIMSEGLFNIRLFLMALSPIYMFFLWKGIFKTILNVFFNKSFRGRISSIVYISLLFGLCLGTISLQVRHKTVLFPFLYILAAYGWYASSTKRFKLLATIMTVLVIIGQVFFLIK